MRRIVYYIAMSIDGYISGPENDVSKFIYSGSGVEKYQSDLQHFDTIIMGRNTYEIGYQFGLKPGQPAYPQMEHYIFSSTLKFSDQHEKVKVVQPDYSAIDQLKQSNGTDIYLCGGGQFAGWLLDGGYIDELRIKLNPIVLGGGASLFGESTCSVKFELIKSESFEHGMQILTYVK